MIGRGFVRGCVVFIATVALMWPAGKPQPPRERLCVDSGWRFHAGDPAAAEQVAFDDSAWRAVDLPHDWSIAGKIDRKNPMGGQGGFFPAGVAWYRRAFRAPDRWRGKQVALEFDGVYMNAEVYLNGRKLGVHPYGYTPFTVDLTPYLEYAGPNVVAVRVDNSRHFNSRWYSGSGIYRHVWLNVAGPIHFPDAGVFVSTRELLRDRARVEVKTRIVNSARAAAQLVLKTVLIAPDGRTAGSAESRLAIGAGEDIETTQAIEVTDPAPWSPESPALYRAVSRVLNGTQTADEMETPFGIRSISWSAEQGFLLNGKSLKLCGGSVHHDNGVLGAAAFDRAEERRVKLLKAAGFNALRTAHNPPSAAFLNACDRIGMLVIDEAFDGWKRGKTPHDYGIVFDDWWERDIDAMVLRDRNHPSVVMWSIGNEVRERADESGPRIARVLADRVRKHDSTRPVTIGLDGIKVWSGLDDLFSVVDIAGYNYELDRHAEDHLRVPSRVIFSSESVSADAFRYWAHVAGNPYVLGDFVWAAQDYLGESGIGRWYYLGGGEKELSHGSDEQYPWHGAYCGDLDLIGTRKPRSHYRNILWNRGERLYIAVREPAPEGRRLKVTRWGEAPVSPSWTWPGREGLEMEVEVYSNFDAVRLLLNGKLVGEMPTGREQQFRALFRVPYAKGDLKAVGLEAGRPAAESVLSTASDAARIRLVPDRRAIAADRQDLSFVAVEVVDNKGQVHPNADYPIRFAIRGPGTIAGLGSGDVRSEESYQGTSRRTFQGRALLVVRGTGAPGRIEITASSPGLTGASVVLRARPAAKAALD